MGLGYLDLNDCSLHLWHQSNSVRSPGYALLENSSYIFGEKARATAQLRPRDINTRYWWQLNSEPLQPALGPARHTGDLAHAHLNSLHQQAGKPDEVLFAVPSSMHTDQLSLLLGIAQHSPFKAVGVVNRSVALASLYASATVLWHLEVQLHQILLSRLVIREGSVHLDHSTVVPASGLLHTQERIVGVIAEAFIQQTRFDPRQKATAEQALYNAVPSALQALQSTEETNIEVDGRQARITAKLLENIGEEVIASVAAKVGSLESTIIADPILGLLPGASGNFQNLHILPQGAVHEALRTHQIDLIQDSANLNYVTSLPVRLDGTTRLDGGPAKDRHLNSGIPPQHATHVLVGATARPLQAEGTSLVAGAQILRQGEEWLIKQQAENVTVNGRHYKPGTALNCGDVLMVDKARFTLIQVES